MATNTDAGSVGHESVVITGVGCRVLPVTCGRDGREHLVADEAMDAGYAGRYVALCGYDLLAPTDPGTWSP